MGDEVLSVGEFSPPLRGGGILKGGFPRVGRRGRLIRGKCRAPLRGWGIGEPHDFVVGVTDGGRPSVTLRVPLPPQARGRS